MGQAKTRGPRDELRKRRADENVRIANAEGFEVMRYCGQLYAVKRNGLVRTMKHFTESKDAVYRSTRAGLRGPLDEQTAARVLERGVPVTPAPITPEAAEPAA